MALLGPDGNPIIFTQSAPIPPKVTPKVEKPFVPTRQLKRAYLRQVAIAHINQHYGLELRPIRRSIALTLAKRSEFIVEVRATTKAW